MKVCGELAQDRRVWGAFILDMVSSKPFTNNLFFRNEIFSRWEWFVPTVYKTIVALTFDGRDAACA